MSNRNPDWLLIEPVVSTPTGTTIGSPKVTTVLAGWNYVNTVRYRFPPGPMGTLGFYLADGTNQVIPFPPSQPWIIGEDEEVTIEYGAPVGGGLNLYTANYGNFAHSIILSIQYYDVATIQAGSTPPALGTTLLSSEMLNTPADQVAGIEDLFQVNEQLTS